MKSGNFCCNRRCQLVKNAARYQRGPVVGNILDSAVQPVAGAPFRHIQPQVSRRANHANIA
ncbi:hypothetical protein ACET77_10375 [Aeromonas allosaccharophila]|uniref:hypothetical protein n=1 Tax=Aeromonas allosaccharophila TaxID=656 RepID=UPI003420CF16